MAAIGGQKSEKEKMVQDAKNTEFSIFPFFPHFRWATGRRGKVRDILRAIIQLN